MHAQLRAVQRSREERKRREDAERAIVPPARLVSEASERILARRPHRGPVEAWEQNFGRLMHAISLVWLCSKSTRT